MRQMLVADHASLKCSKVLASVHPRCGLNTSMNSEHERNKEEEAMLSGNQARCKRSGACRQDTQQYALYFY
jgi:hypothetical protein